jgi:hypothetical protein
LWNDVREERERPIEIGAAASSTLYLGSLKICKSRDFFAEPSLPDARLSD